MSDSLRYRVIVAIKERLSAIQVERGFNTNAGLTIFAGEVPLLGEGDPDEAIAIVTSIDEPGYQGENVVGVFPFEIQALVKVTAKVPLLAVENVVADIKTAVELGLDEDRKRNLNGIGIPFSFERGQTRVLDREPGSVDIGVGVLYRITLKEAWGHP